LKPRPFTAGDSPLFQQSPHESLAKCAVWANAPSYNGSNAVDSEAAQERNGPMTKNELIAAVAGKAQMTKTAAATAVEATFDAITSTLKRGGEVKIMGFGNFRVVKRAAREGRDPRTGTPVKIKAAKRPRFSAGKGLKEAVNR
jgi:DNA-binding protein HU-beta